MADHEEVGVDEAALAGLGLGPAQRRPESSMARFPDGGAYRIEIPSVEGPEAIRAVVESARDLAVPVHRVSQGSGVMMLTDGEISEAVGECKAAGVELVLFVGPRASWDIGAQRFTEAGSLGARVRGYDQLWQCVADARRAADLGVRSLLLADEGLLWVLHALRERGDLPGDLQLKVSVLAGPANPASFCLLERLGADTINVPPDLTLWQVAELRAVGAAAIDFYVEAPDNLGGFVRLYDVAELVRVGAPIYLKFGLRNAPDIYPSGGHLRQTVVATARERVRRARLGLDMLTRLGRAGDMSPIGSRVLPRPGRVSISGPLARSPQ